MRLLKVICPTDPFVLARLPMRYAVFLGGRLSLARTEIANDNRNHRVSRIFLVEKFEGRPF